MLEISLSEWIKKIVIQKAKLASLTIGASLLFALLVTSIPAIQFEDRPQFGPYFLEIVLLIFITTALLGSLLKLERVMLILLVVVFIIPLTNVTSSGWYNIASTGILFGTLFQFSYQRIHLEKQHWLIFVAVFLLGLYYNLIPFFFGDNDGFNNKLWLFNIYVFIKYVYIGLLFIQIQYKLKNITKYILWFAFLYAFFIILDAYHIRTINFWMKMFTIYSYHPISEGSIERIAYDYFRASGLAIDANFAGIKTTILMALVLYKYQTNTLTIIWLVPFIFLAIWLTGSKAGLILSLIVIVFWTFHIFKQQYHWRFSFAYLWFFTILFSLFFFIGIQNTSFQKTFDIARDRYFAFVTGESIKSDASTSFRIKEITDISITAFGDRSDHLLTVHSELARLIRFYGIFGTLLTVSFWLFYLFIVRYSYLAVSLVTLIAINSFWKWAFHSEDVFMPVFIITILIIGERKNNANTAILNNRTGT